MRLTVCPVGFALVKSSWRMRSSGFHENLGVVPSVGLPRSIHGVDSGLPNKEKAAASVRAVGLKAISKRTWLGAV